MARLSPDTDVRTASVGDLLSWRDDGGGGDGCNGNAVGAKAAGGDDAANLNGHADDCGGRGTSDENSLSSFASSFDEQDGATGVGRRFELVGGADDGSEEEGAAGTEV